MRNLLFPIYSHTPHTPHTPSLTHFTDNHTLHAHTFNYKPTQASLTYTFHILPPHTNTHPSCTRPNTPHTPSRTLHTPSLTRHTPLTQLSAPHTPLNHPSRTRHTHPHSPPYTLTQPATHARSRRSTRPARSLEECMHYLIAATGYNYFHGQ